ncbi:MAG: hypothetical protein U5K56_07285 [Halioglobus sp.]|nr:hypothetical protein [Halioglobus sp.]
MELFRALEVQAFEVDEVAVGFFPRHQRAAVIAVVTPRQRDTHTRQV